MNTVLNAVYVGCDARLNAASSPVTAMPSMPSGRYFPDQQRDCVVVGEDRGRLLPRPGFTVTSARRPGGTTTIAGRKIFG